MRIKKRGYEFSVHNHVLVFLYRIRSIGSLKLCGFRSRSVSIFVHTTTKHIAKYTPLVSVIETVVLEVEQYKFLWTQTKKHIAKRKIMIIKKLASIPKFHKNSDNVAPPMLTTSLRDLMGPINDLFSYFQNYARFLCFSLLIQHIPRNCPNINLNNDSTIVNVLMFINLCKMTT